MSLGSAACQHCGTGGPDDLARRAGDLIVSSQALWLDCEVRSTQTIDPTWATKSR